MLSKLNLIKLSLLLKLKWPTSVILINQIKYNAQVFFDLIKTLWCCLQMIIWRVNVQLQISQPQIMLLKLLHQLHHNKLSKILLMTYVSPCGKMQKADTPGISVT